MYANTTGNVEIQSRQILIDGPGTGVRSDSAGVILIGELAVLTATHVDASLVSGNAGQMVNRGVLTAVSTDATAVALEATTAFANLGSGSVAGAVRMGNGDSQVLLADSSTLNGVLYTGSGDNTVVVQGNDVSYGQLLGGTDGLDTLVLDAHDYTATAENVDQVLGFERLDLVNGTTLSLERDLVVDGTATSTSGTGAGWVSIDRARTLAALEGGHTVRGSVANTGHITMSTGLAGKHLTVAGNYLANDGVVELDAVLGDDASVSDKVVIQGNSAGQGYLKVNNAGGAGAATIADGIQVIEVEGSSDAAFVLSERVVAGAHEYLLVKGGKADPNNGDWYLRSEVPIEPGEPKDPVQPVEPKDPVQPVEPDVPGVPATPEHEVAPPVTPAVPMYRPETSAYLANQAAASGMFNHTLHERLGEVDYSERQRQEGVGNSVWMRVKRDQFNGRTGNGQIDSGTDTNLMQVNTEVIRWDEGAIGGRGQLGVMAGMGQADSSVGSSASGIRAKGRVKGRSVGVYGTWYQSAKQPTGAYVDSWMQYGDFDHSAQGEGLQKERYSSRSLTGSVEVGYAFELDRGDTHGLHLEPQVQAIFTDYRNGDHVEVNGTRVRSDKAGGLTTRVGARLYTRALENIKNRVQPFVEVNWWHGGATNRIAFIEKVLQQNRADNLYEVKAGAQVELGSGWSGWGEFGLRAGDGHDQAVSGLIGIKRGW